LTLNRDERLALVERDSRELPLTTQCELLSLNRSSLYYQPVPVSDQEIALKHAIDEVYTASPFYGSRRIAEELRQHRHMPVARETIQRCMREMGIAGICPGPNLSKRNARHTIYPYLLRHVTAGYPNHVWGIDITYIRLRGGWMYLVAVLDWYSRYVVSWELDQTLAMPFVLAAVQRALVQARPAIWNSDQGTHFTSVQYTQLLLDAGVQISMDGRGRAMDNIFTERLWRTIKYEEVYLKEYASPRDARRSLAEYLDFYNYRRLHQGLDYQTPAALYCAQMANTYDQPFITVPPSRASAGCG
jgi:putative transposase